MVSPPTLDLEIHGPDGKRLLQRLAGPTLSIGRADSNSIVLKHDDVSRRHAIVEVVSGGLVVKDVSTNGTFVDGRRIQGQLQLPLGRPVKVGPYLLKFRTAEAAAPSPAPSHAPSKKTPPPPPRRASHPPRNLSATPPPPMMSGESQVVPMPQPPRLDPEQPTVMAEGAVVVDEELLVERVPQPQARSSAPLAKTREQPAPQIAQPPQRPRRKTPPPPVAALHKPPSPARPAPPAAPQQKREMHQAATETRPFGPRDRAVAAMAQVGIPAAVAQQVARPDLSDNERDRLKRWLRGLLLEALDLPALRPEELQDKALAPRVLQVLDELLDEHARELPKGLDRGRLRKELGDEVLGLGPLEDLLADEKVTEVMVVDRATIYVEKGGRLELTGARFSSEDALRSAIERIVTPLGRRIDESTPMVDARLKDGSRVNAIIPPLALRGPCLTIRKFARRKLELHDLIGYGSLDERMARFLMRAVIARRNVLVSGGTGSGKTTLLNVLSSAIPEDERIVTIEDAAELRLHQPHVVSLETRPANMEGRGEYTIRDLVRNALRMRPDRIIVGECRGGEALDMLQAMNTGHDGSLTTTHANSPEEAVARLETLVLMAGIELPTRAIREQIANSIHVVVQQARFVDGSRKITQVAEVVGIDDDGTVKLEPIFEFVRHPSERGRVEGEYRATGYLPTFLGEFITMGLVTDGEYL